MKRKIMESWMYFIELEQDVVAVCKDERLKRSWKIHKSWLMKAQEKINLYIISE